MDGNISWHVELRVKSDSLDAFRVLTTEMVDATQGERGVQIYERYISTENQVIVHVLERYVDSSAAVAHLTAFERVYGERLASLVERKQFTVFGMPSTELRGILDRYGAIYAAPLAGYSRV